jgi:hypothetical protein
MGPRRFSLVLALLALGLLLASAGVAAASSDAPEGGSWSSGPTASVPAAQGADGGQWTDHVPADVAQPHDGKDPSGGNGSGGNGSGGSNSGDHGSGVGGSTQDPPPVDTGTWTDEPSNGGTGGTGTPAGSGGGGTVGGTSVGTPPTPVEAPPATASGPAPDAVAAAPISTPAEQVFAPAFGAEGGGGTGATDTPLAAIVTAPAAPVASASLGDLPTLGSVGKLAATAGGGPAAAGTLLSTGTGRSIAVVLALLGAILLFLSIHRRVDRSDPKLASAQTGPDVVRFR